MVRTAGLHLLHRGRLRFSTAGHPGHWELAMGLSGDYPSRTSTDESMVTSRHTTCTGEMVVSSAHGTRCWPALVFFGSGRRREA